MHQFSRLSILAVAGFMISFSGCQIATPGSGIATTELRQVDEFTSILLSGSGDVDVSVGPEKSVEVTLDDNLIHLVTTEVRNGELRIGTNGSWSTNIGLKVTITVPELVAYRGSGSGDAIIRNIGSEKFDATISGSGSIVAEGICQEVTASISGSGDIDLTKLPANKASAKITGSGDVAIHASETATASIAGSGNIDVHGNPAKIAESISGSGDVNRR